MRTAQPEGDRAPTPAQVSQAGEVRLSRIESLRALAAMGVVIGHAWGIAYAFGPQARDNYFARMVYGSGQGAFLLLGLSGYLLFWPFVRHYWAGRTPMDMKQYALNRALRLLPLYFFAVGFLLIVQHGGGTRWQWLTFLSFSENFNHNYLFTVDGPLWTLVVELHFYIALPFVAWFLARASRGRVLPAMAILFLISAPSCALWTWAVVYAHPRQVLWEHSLPGCFYFMGAGMLLALTRFEVERRKPAWLNGRLARGDLWLAAAVVIWLVIFTNYHLLPFVTVATFLTIGACVLPLRNGPLVRALDWKPLAVVGIASYSLYVWHLPLQEWITGYDGKATGVATPFLIAVPLCVLVALASYRLIEAPFLKLRSRWSPASAPIPASDSPRTNNTSRAEAATSR